MSYRFFRLTALFVALLMISALFCGCSDWFQTKQKYDFSDISTFDYTDAETEAREVTTGKSASDLIEIAFPQCFLPAPELEELLEDTMRAVRRAWGQMVYDKVYEEEYNYFVKRGETEEKAVEYADKYAEYELREIKSRLFNPQYYYYYRYYGTYDGCVVMGTVGMLQAISSVKVGEYVFNFSASASAVYVYKDGEICTAAEAYEKGMIKSEHIEKALQVHNTYDDAYFEWVHSQRN